MTRRGFRSAALRIGVSLALVLAGACARTTLDVPENHPANPDAPTPKAAHVATALAPDFDPEDPPVVHHGAARGDSNTR